MTAPAWRSLPPGRELDAVVAERVMYADTDRDLFDRVIQADGTIGAVPHYSTRIEDAWKVVDLVGTGLKLHEMGHNEWYCSVGYGRTVWAGTAAHAICLAALTAVEVAE